MEKCAELAKLTNSNTILSELRQNLKNIKQPVEPLKIPPQMSQK